METKRGTLLVFPTRLSQADIDSLRAVARNTHSKPATLVRIAIRDFLKKTIEKTAS